MHKKAKHSKFKNAGILFELLTLGMRRLLKI